MFISIGVALTIIVMLTVGLLTRPGDVVVLISPPSVLEGTRLRTVSEIAEIMSELSSASCSDLIEIVVVYRNSVVTVECP